MGFLFFKMFKNRNQSVIGIGLDDPNDFSPRPPDWSIPSVLGNLSLHQQVLDSGVPSVFVLLWFLASTTRSHGSGSSKTNSHSSGLTEGVVMALA